VRRRLNPPEGGGRPSGRWLGRKQLDIAEAHLGSPAPGSLKIETGDRGHDVHANRIDADLKKYLGFREIVRRYFGGGSAEG
jgi:hypothetical protein